MEALTLNGTAKTPHVFFDKGAGVLDLRGRSNPENPIEFYRPIIRWVGEYILHPSDKTVVNIQLEYFNTSSSKCLLDLFKKLERLGGHVSVQWFYEQDDEDMLESGEDYDAIINLPFKMVEVEEMNDMRRATSYVQRIEHLRMIYRQKNNKSLTPLSA